ncbi:hypothetical protein SteCoe_13341 [Stentor coeruleus]|uniref:Uncharacterized protein n=1 Tax=Stentor coeruleus TaxID=5963 RepID=A0A1R2C8M5_9CILI|nr:hypothetical protein SteCoe_13341 [Stentor coeruleus]
MTEKKLIEFLSEESEKMGNEWIDEKIGFDTDICGWKEIHGNTISIQHAQPEPVRFRIRTIENRTHLTRSNSSTSQVSTISSSNGSRNGSPGSESARITKKQANMDQAKKKKEPFTLCHPPEDVPILAPAPLPTCTIKIHKPPRPRKQRKPIKVFKLPKVDQNNEE